MRSVASGRSTSRTRSTRASRYWNGHVAQFSREVGESGVVLGGQQSGNGADQTVEACELGGATGPDRGDPGPERRRRLDEWVAVEWSPPLLPVAQAADVALRQRSLLTRRPHPGLERRHDTEPAGVQSSQLLGAHRLAQEGARALEQPAGRQALALRARIGARVGERPHRRGGERGQVVAAFLRAPDGVDRQRRPREATSAVGDERILASEGRERAFGHPDDVHDVEVTAVRVPYAADEHAGAEAPHASRRRVQLGLQRPHERGQRRLAADLGQRRQAVERVGDAAAPPPPPARASSPRRPSPPR